MRPGLALLAVLLGCSRSERTVAPAGDAAARPAPPTDDAAAAPRTVADLATAIAELITDEVRVVGFGELHQRLDRPLAARSALARFTEEVLPVIAGRTSDLVLETWQLDRRCGAAAGEATARVEATVQRPAETRSELGTLIDAARAAGVQPHALRVTCDDWARIAPPGGEVDHEALLTLITTELARVAEEALAYRDRTAAPRRLIALYGGALHNDLRPIEGLADWSFAARVDEAAAGAYRELDLYVPELAEGDALTRSQPWSALLASAPPDRVTVIERGPRSYILLLPRAVGANGGRGL
jgi:hypothetical protein